MTEQLHTVEGVINELGDASAVARLLGITQPAVSNWKKRGAFPPWTYVALLEALNAKGMTAPASLWRMGKSAESTSA
jgi:hypothetical protein